MSKAQVEKQLTVVIKKEFHENLTYIVNLCVQSKIMIKIKGTKNLTSSSLLLQLQFL